MREDRGDVSSSIDFPVNAFEGVAGAQADLMNRRQGKDGKALGQVFFHPGSEFWSRFEIRGNEFFEASVCGQKIRRVEDGTDIGSHPHASKIR